MKIETLHRNIQIDGFSRKLGRSISTGPRFLWGGSCLFPWSTPPSPTIHPGPEPWGPPWCPVLSYPPSHSRADPARSSFRVQPPPGRVLTSSALAPLPWTRAVTALWAPCSCPWSPPHPFFIRKPEEPRCIPGPPLRRAPSAPCFTWSQPGLLQARGPFEIRPSGLSDHLCPQLLCPGHTSLLAGPPTGQGPPASGPLHLLLL